MCRWAVREHARIGDAQLPRGAVHAQLVVDDAWICALLVRHSATAGIVVHRLHVLVDIRVECGVARDVGL